MFCSKPQHCGGTVYGVPCEVDLIPYRLIYFYACRVPTQYFSFVFHPFISSSPHILLEISPRGFHLINTFYSTSLWFSIFFSWIINPYGQCAHSLILFLILLKTIPLKCARLSSSTWHKPCHSWEEETSVEESPPSDWLVSHFLDC